MHTLILDGSGLKNRSSTARTPWAKMDKDAKRYHAAEVMPEGLGTHDPEKYSKQETRRILSHWFERQTKGLAPFIFSGEDYSTAESKGKKKHPGYVEPDSENEGK